MFKEAKVSLKMILDQAVLSRKCYQANKGRSSSSHDVYNQDTLPRNELLCQLFGGHRYQWISHKMNIWHPGQLKKLKSWGPFWSYQLNSTANSAHFARFLGKWSKLAVLFSW